VFCFCPYIELTPYFSLPPSLLPSLPTCALSPWNVIRQILSRDLYASFKRERAAPLAAVIRLSAMEPAGRRE